MGNLLDRFVDWALTKKHWPILIPAVGAPVVFVFTRLYFELSFRETIHLWLFWLPTGLLLILPGLLLTKKSDVYPFLIGEAFLLIGLGATVGSLAYSAPPTLPQDRLVVTITSFVPISPGAEDESNNIAHRIEQKLLEKQKLGAPLKVKRLKDRVTGEEEAERESNAIKIGRSRKGNAHLVIWGEVRKDGEELFVQPHLTVANQLENASMGRVQIGDYTSLQPTDISFKNELSQAIADAVMLIWGLAYLNTGQWEQATELFNRVDLDGGHFLKAQALLEQSRVAKNPREYIMRAVDAYEKIKAPIKENFTEGNVLPLFARLNKANALTTLAGLSPPGDAERYMRGAVDGYEMALELVTLEKWPDMWAIIQNNLANILRDKGMSLKALEATKKALEVRTRKKWPQEWAMTQNNLGAVLRDLSEQSEGEESKKFLHEAIEAFHAALEVRTENEFPQDWAQTQNNLGEALMDMGVHFGGQEGIKFLRRSVEEIKNTFRVRTAERDPLGWSSSHHNLAAALANLGSNVSGEEGTKLNQEALLSIRNALRVRRKEELPGLWAVSQLTLANVLSNLGTLSEGEEGKSLINEAIDVYRKLLEVQLRRVSPQAWAKIQHGLGGALTNLGAGLGVLDGVPPLQKAVHAYENALEVWSREKNPENWASTQLAFGIALINLGSRMARMDKERGRRIIDEALDRFDKASHVYNNENFPSQHQKIIEGRSSAEKTIAQIRQEIIKEGGTFLTE